LNSKPNTANPHLEAATCCAALDDNDGAMHHVAPARRCADFDSQDQRALELDPEPPRNLRVISGRPSGGFCGSVRVVTLPGSPLLGRLPSGTPRFICTA